jgi:hypothetical protein
MTLVVMNITDIERSVKIQVSGPVRAPLMLGRRERGEWSWETTSLPETLTLNAEVCLKEATLPTPPEWAASTNILGAYALTPAALTLSDELLKYRVSQIKNILRDVQKQRKGLEYERHIEELSNWTGEFIRFRNYPGSRCGQLLTATLSLEKEQPHRIVVVLLENEGNELKLSLPKN